MGERTILQLMDGDSKGEGDLFFSGRVGFQKLFT